MKPNPIYMTKITLNDRFNYDVASDGFKVNIALGATANDDNSSSIGNGSASQTNAFSTTFTMSNTYLTRVGEEQIRGEFRTDGEYT